MGSSVLPYGPRHSIVFPPQNYHSQSIGSALRASPFVSFGAFAQNTTQMWARPCGPRLRDVANATGAHISPFRCPSRGLGRAALDPTTLIVPYMGILSAFAAVYRCLTTSNELNLSLLCMCQCCSWCLSTYCMCSTFPEYQAYIWWFCSAARWGMHMRQWCDFFCGKISYNVMRTNKYDEHETTFKWWQFQLGQLSGSAGDNLLFVFVLSHL